MNLCIIVSSPGHDAFLLVAKIVENSSKVSDFEEKGTFKLGDDGRDLTFQILLHNRQNKVYALGTVSSRD